MTNDQVTHHVVVDGGAAGAFDAFAAHLGAWWPIAYTFSGTGFVDAAVEPRVGGVWFESNDAGESLPWGRVLGYAPGERLVLGFAIGADRKPVPDASASEVELRFVPGGPGRTRVELAHRNFERHGEAAHTLRTGMDSAQGWPLILAELRRWLHARPAIRYIVTSVESAIGFYTGQFGFAVDMRPAPGFAALSRGPVRLLLNEPGAGGAGARTTDNREPAPGGWNRLQLTIADLPSDIARLREAGCRFRGDLVEGRGGRQILVEDPAGNPIELFEPQARA
jgi:uncharacterized protein YndB with AHSA1/START domain/predicted enzyme related to lactoylglutathione lyase